jgi:hypothetical protein
MLFRTIMLSAFLFAALRTAMAQENVQLTQVPPRPTCTPILRNGSCSDLWRTYNQALAQRQREVMQIYVNRQKELASEAATAPLQQQIADLNKLVSDQQGQIKSLQDQMQEQAKADAAAALQVKETDAADAASAKAAAALSEATAHKEGLVRGLEIGAGGMFLLFAVIFGIVKFSRSFTITNKAQSASALVNGGWEGKEYRSALSNLSPSPILLR